MKFNFRLNKNSPVITVALLILAAIIAGWLLYNNYLKPEYELAKLLPADHQISFEWQHDRFSLSGLQQEKLLNNPTINLVYQQAISELSGKLEQFSQPAGELIKKVNHAILFFVTPEQYGLLLDIKDKADQKNIDQLDFSPWSKRVLKNQILILTSQPELLEKINDQQTKRTLIPYLSIEIAPFATVRFQNSFFSGDYNSGLLGDLKNILSPLADQPAENYSLTAKTDAFNLKLVLTPDTLPKQEPITDLTPYLKLIPDSDVIIASANPASLQRQLEQQDNLKNIWQILDGRLWISHQLSLSNLLKQLQPPLIFSLKGNDWQIITSTDNRSSAEYYLKNYLAQFSPKEQLKVLPDGSLATELIADTTAVKLNDDEEENGWQISQFTDSSLVLAQKDGFLLIGNNLNPGIESDFWLNCQKDSQQESDGQIIDLIKLRTYLPVLNFSGELKAFNNLELISQTNGEIRACLGL